MSPFSPYCTYYGENPDHKSDILYNIWSVIVYNNSKSNISRGYYNTQVSVVDDELKIRILHSLVMNMIQTHDILKDYLISTENKELIYSVSKYESRDKKWLGYNYEKNYGDNYLGKAWMNARSEILHN